MDIAVSEAKAQLTDLVRRAQTGEEIVLTRHGQPIVRLTPIARAARSAEERARLIAEAQAEAARTMIPGPPAERSQDYLYDEFGLPG